MFIAAVMNDFVQNSYPDENLWKNSSNYKTLAFNVLKGFVCTRGLNVISLLNHHTSSLNCAKHIGKCVNNY